MPRVRQCNVKSGNSMGHLARGTGYHMTNNSRLSPRRGLGCTIYTALVNICNNRYCNIGLLPVVPKINVKELFGRDQIIQL